MRDENYVARNLKSATIKAYIAYKYLFSFIRAILCWLSFSKSRVFNNFSPD